MSESFLWESSSAEGEDGEGEEGGHGGADGGELGFASALVLLLLVSVSVSVLMLVLVIVFSFYVVDGWWFMHVNSFCFVLACLSVLSCQLSGRCGCLGLTVVSVVFWWHRRNVFTVVYSPLLKQYPLRTVRFFPSPEFTACVIPLPPLLC